MKLLQNKKGELAVFMLVLGALLILSVASFFFSEGKGITGYSVFAGGEGTVNNPYQISNCTQLNATRTNLAASYVLIAEINCSMTKTWNAGQGFEPIGTFLDYPASAFQGKFNGKGHTISGLYINRTGTDDVGLFGGFGNGAVISNVDLVKVNITGHNDVGGLIGGSILGTIVNVSSTGVVAGNQFIGNLIGYLETSIVFGSYATGAATGSSNVGGLVGDSWLSSVFGSYATGAATGSSYVGGLVGNLDTSNVSDSYATGAVSGSFVVGGLVSYSNGGICTNSFWDNQTTGQSASDCGAIGKTTAQMKNKTTFASAGWDFTNTWDIHSAANNGYPYLKQMSKPSSYANSDILIKWDFRTFSRLPLPTEVVVGDKFVYVNSSSPFNSSANLSFSNVDCSYPYVYTLTSATSSTTRAQVISTGKLRTKTAACMGGVLSYHVNGFSAYAVGTLASLTISDSAEGSFSQRATDVTFYADYKNITSGSPILNATCWMNITGRPKVLMNYSSGLGKYVHLLSGGFSVDGFYKWSVNCSHPSYNQLIATDNITVIDTVPPIKPVLWNITELSTIHTNETNFTIIGYIGEPSVTISAVVWGSGFFPDTFTKGTNYSCQHITDSTVVKKVDTTTKYSGTVFYINSADYPLFNAYKNKGAVLFSGHERKYLKLYNLGGVSWITAEKTWVNLSETLEKDVLVGETVGLYNCTNIVTHARSNYPAGWFNITLTLDAGDDQIEVFGKDVYNNTGPIFKFYMFYDVPPFAPAIKLLYPNGTIRNIQNITFRYNASSANTTAPFTCSLYLDNVLKNTRSDLMNSTIVNYTINPVSLGGHNWSVTCTDSEGTSTSRRSFNIIDTSNPIFDLRAVPGYSLTKDPLIRFRVSDLTGVNKTTLYVNASNSTKTKKYNHTVISCVGANTLLNCSLQLVNLTLKQNNLTFYVKDVNGNKTINRTSIYVDTTAPAIISVKDRSYFDPAGNVVDNRDALTSNLANNISAEIIAEDNETAIARFNVSLGTETNPTNITNWTIKNATKLKPGNASDHKYFINVSFANEPLKDQTMYFVYVYAINNASSLSSRGSSDGILFDDNTGPTTPNVVDSGVFTTSPAVLYFNWSAVDLQSGIAYYEVMLGNRTVNNSVFDFRNVGLNTSMAFRNGFKEGQNYTLYMRAWSNSLHSSDIAHSNGIIVDTTPSIGGAIRYTDGYEVKTPIKVNVTIGTDNISGIKSAALNITASDLDGDICSGELGRYSSLGIQNLSLVNGLVNVSVSSGRCYQFMLIVTNGAGLRSDYNSTAITKVDLSAPARYTAIDAGDSFHTHKINATLVASDPESGITQFNYSITQGVKFGGGCTGPPCVVYNWTIVNATDNAAFVMINETKLDGANYHFSNGQIYYFNVKAKNNAGNWSIVNSSNGIVWLDEEAPVTNVVSVSGSNRTINLSGRKTYIDKTPNGKTDIIIKGEVGMTCKYYTQDVQYQAGSGSYCAIMGADPTFTLRNCSIQSLSQGTYTRYISCKDQYNNGQTEKNNLDVTWVVDYSGPSITIISPMQNESVGYVVPLAAFVTDSGVGIINLTRYNISNASNGKTIVKGVMTHSNSSGAYGATWNSTKNISTHGTFNLTITARDALGFNFTKSVRFNVDNSIPDISFYNPVNNSIKRGLFRLNISVSDDVRVNYTYYQIRNSSQGVVQPNSSRGNLGATYWWRDGFNTSRFRDGVYSITVYVQDSQRNNKTKIRYFTIDNTPPQYSAMALRNSPSYNNKSATIELQWIDPIPGSGVLNSSVKFTHSATGSNVTYNGTVGASPHYFEYTISSSLLHNQQLVWWKSCANDTIGNSACTPWQNFTVRDRPPFIKAGATLIYTLLEDTSKLINLSKIFGDPDNDNLNYTFELVGVVKK